MSVWDRHVPESKWELKAKLGLKNAEDINVMERATDILPPLQSWDDSRQGLSKYNMEIDQMLTKAHLAEGLYASQIKRGILGYFSLTPLRRSARILHIGSIDICWQTFPSVFVFEFDTSGIHLTDGWLKTIDRHLPSHAFLLRHPTSLMMMSQNTEPRCFIALLCRRDSVI